MTYKVWHPGLTREQSSIIEHLQARVLNLAFPQLEYHDALNEAGLEALEQRKETTKCRQFFNNITHPNHKLNYVLPEKRDKSYLRNSRPYEPPKFRTDCYKKSLINYGLLKFQSCF